jgi:potassium-dependent mechanosensitive channel
MKWIEGEAPVVTKPGDNSRPFAFWRRTTEALAIISLLLLTFHSRPAIVSAQIKLPGQPPVPAQPAAPPATAAPSTVDAPQPIALPQIADQAEALDMQLEEISRGLTTQADETKPNPAISSQSAEIAERARQVDAFLEGGPDIVQLREEIVYWRSLSRLSVDQRKQLTDRADQLQAQIALLTQEQAIWQATRDSIHDAEGIEVVAARVQQELEAIRDLRLRAQGQLNQVLTAQNELSETGRRIAETMTKLNDAEARFRVSIFSQDGKPLWSRGALGEANQPVEFLLRRSADQEFATAEEYLRARGAGLLLAPIIFILSLAAALRLRQYLRTRTGPEIPAEAHAVFGHPFVVALIVTMVLSIPQTQSAPLSVIGVLYVLWLAILFRLTPFLVKPEMRSLTYLLLAANLLEVLRAAVPLAPGTRRLILPLIILAVLIVFGWLTRPSKIRQLGLSKWPRIVLEVASRVGLLFIVAALLANIFGFVSLSRILGVGTLLSAFFAAALYFVIHIVLLALTVLLESPWLGSVSGDMRSAISLWAKRLLIVFAVVVWWTRSELYIFMLQESFASTVTGVLEYPIGVGKLYFTLGSVFAVLLILGIGFALAKGTSSLMRSVLLARFPLQRGMPYAASKVTYYLLSVLVLLAAISAAGVDLNKFTVITGAVGVGVGFGLQDIVKNFASGLILLFERPIRVDDVIELTGMVGTVRRIGARSSTIVTAQGAEVIVPNSILVSTQVINWTLSSQQRRIEIMVGVAYGTDPDRVLQLLAAEAGSHESVMTDPAPVAYFMGFGDSALNFELRFWSERQDIWFQLKSEVTVGVARALTEAGIEIPFPQRDLHLRSVDPAVPSQSLPPAFVPAKPYAAAPPESNLPEPTPSFSADISRS